MSDLKSLKKVNHPLSKARHQRKVLEEPTNLMPVFIEKLSDLGFDSFTSRSVETLQINMGKMCNQVCEHCHVDAGPDRKEIMTKGTMIQCIEAIKSSNITTVDLTGGAPEMNPNFKWFVQELFKLKKEMGE